MSTQQQSTNKIITVHQTQATVK